MRWVFQAIRDGLWTVGINCGHLTSIRGGFTQHLMLIWVIKQDFCDWAVGSLGGKVQPRCVVLVLCHLLLPELQLCSGAEQFSLCSWEDLISSWWAPADCWAGIGTCILFLGILCVRGGRVVKSFFGAELWDFFLCLFSFTNKRCQIESCPCSEGMGWHSVDEGLLAESGITEPLSEMLWILAWCYWSKWLQEVRVAVVSQVFNGLLKTLSWWVLTLAAWELEQGAALW